MLIDGNEACFDRSDNHLQATPHLNHSPGETFYELGGNRLFPGCYSLFSTDISNISTVDSRHTHLQYRHLSMPLRKKRKLDETGQILLFEVPAAKADTEQTSSDLAATQPAKDRRPTFSPEPRPSVVICGSFRKDTQGLSKLHEQFLDLHYSILSPLNVDIRREEDGFVYMRGEETETPETLERRHLDAIEQADFVWLHAPDGYVGLSASVEIGYATAVGTPIFSVVPPQDPMLKTLVRIIDRPEVLVSSRPNVPPSIPKPAIARFQNYYRKVAMQRGYERESAQNCLLLMVEEIGELARGLRRDQKLTRDHSSDSESLPELADVFIYVVHMANILNADLAQIVKDKEAANWARFLRNLQS
jgi:NTP pyrophosphatase (non-canonical NTP hydrolase)